MSTSRSLWRVSKARLLVDVLAAARHEVHEEVVAEGLRGGEVGLASAHGGHFLDELDQLEIVGEHKSVDHNAGSLAAAYFFQRFLDDDGVEAKSVLVDAAVLHGECGGLAVGDHDDLLHVLAAALQDAPGDAEAFSGIGVVRADFDTRELGDGDVLGGVVEQDEVDGVAGELGANEMGEGHCDALGRGESVFAVEDHGVRAVQENYGRA